MRLFCPVTGSLLSLYFHYYIVHCFVSSPQWSCSLFYSRNRSLPEHIPSAYNHMHSWYYFLDIKTQSAPIDQSFQELTTSLEDIAQQSL